MSEPLALATRPRGKWDALWTALAHVARGFVFVWLCVFVLAFAANLVPAQWEPVFNDDGALGLWLAALAVVYVFGLVLRWLRWPTRVSVTGAEIGFLRGQKPVRTIAAGDISGVRALHPLGAWLRLAWPGWPNRLRSRPATVRGWYELRCGRRVHHLIPADPGAFEARAREVLPRAFEGRVPGPRFWQRSLAFFYRLLSPFPAALVGATAASLIAVPAVILKAEPDAFASFGPLTARLALAAHAGAEAPDSEYLTAALSNAVNNPDDEVARAVLRAGAVNGYFVVHRFHSGPQTWRGGHPAACPPVRLRSSVSKLDAATLDPNIKLVIDLGGRTAADNGRALLEEFKRCLRNPDFAAEYFVNAVVPASQRTERSSGAASRTAFPLPVSFAGVSAFDILEVGSVDLLQLAMKDFAVDERNWMGQTLLMAALQKLQRGAFGDYGEPAPQERLAFVRVIALLVESGADLAAQDRAGRSVAYYAVRARGLDADYARLTGRGPVVERILAAAAPGRTSLGESLLDAAAAGGERDQVQRLARSASVARERTYDARTPLHFASTPEAVGELVARGFDVNAADQDKRTPLHHAAMRMRGEAAMALVKAGARTEEPDAYGRTPIQYNPDYLMPTREQVARRNAATKASKGARK